METTAKLDRKDRKILQELDMKARQSVSLIAKKVGLSREVVNYRINQLIKTNLIKNFYAVIDYAKLGYAIYRILLRFQNVNPSKEKEIIDWLKNHSSVGWIASLEGNWDLVILVWARNTSEFKRIYNEFNYEYGKYIQQKLITIATKIHHFKHNYLYNIKDLSEVVSGEDIRIPIKLDNTDIKILVMLAKNSRISLLEISQKLNLIPNTIKYRIKKLIKNKIILAFRTALNLQLLGYLHYKIFLMLQGITKEKESRLIAFLKYNQNVIYITEAIGQFDLEFEMSVKSNVELNIFMKELKNRFPDIIRNYETILTYYEHQINYLPLL